MSSDQSSVFPLWDYIHRLSGGCRLPLSKVLENQDKLPYSTFWYHTPNADGHNHEALFQLLWGYIEDDNTFHWTM